jgi:hypothetical protein
VAEWGDASREFPYAKAKLAVQDGALFLAFEVKDPTPWLNNGVDKNLLFKTGDAVDFQFAADPAASPNRNNAAAGDRRLLIASFGGKPVAVLYDYVVPGSAAQPVMFSSPTQSTRVDRVRVLDEADVRVIKSKNGYTVSASVPLGSLGLDASLSGEIRADLGVIYGDEKGTVNILRSYWSNTVTGLVDDVPGETRLSPNRWGILEIK